MKRAPPTMTAGQAASITRYSQHQAASEAQAQRAEAMGRDLEQSLTRWQADLKKNSDEMRTVEKWLPRFTVFPVTLLAIGGIFVTVYGLWSGDLPAIAKYSKVHVLRTVNPVAFWFACVYHSAIASVFSWLAIRLFKATGWLSASKKIAAPHCKINSDSRR
nr:hypothetical protein [uncultured Albidiferax sp.]